MKALNSKFSTKIPEKMISSDGKIKRELFFPLVFGHSKENVFLGFVQSAISFTFVDRKRSGRRGEFFSNESNRRISNDFSVQWLSLKDVKKGSLNVRLQYFNLVSDQDALESVWRIFVFLFHKKSFSSNFF